jgi:hypothetical protein
VRRVAKRLYDPSRLTVVIAGTPVEGHATVRPKPPVRPAATPVPSAKPADKPVTGPITAPKKP